MRVQPRYTILLVIASAILLGRDVRAQNTLPPSAVMPPANYSPIQAGQGGSMAGPAPLAWPNISPFENGYERYENTNGLWERLTRPIGRKYYANADVFSARVRKPSDALVGNQEIVNRQLATGLPTPTPLFAVVGTDVMFTGLLADRANNPANITQFVDPVQVFERRANPNHPDEFGPSLTWGYTNPSGDGFEASILYVPQANYFFQRGPGGPGLVGDDVSVTASVPFNDGTPDGTFVPYDRTFRIDFETETAGGSTSWLFTPMVDRGWFKLQPMIGLRYTWIGERFSFFGADSNALAFFNPTGEGVTVIPIPGLNPYESEIDMHIDSHLVGPEIGMRFMVGGENLRVTGGSAIGLAANFENLKLSGRGVGDGFAGGAGNLLFDPTRGFRETRENVRLSPMASAQISMEARIFQFIPLLRKMSLLEDARFRLGYKIVAASEIQRPHKTIVYNAQPLIPVIKEDDRTRWHVHGWTMGINWDF